MEVDAIIVFVDIRGFTKWAEGTEAFRRIDDFAKSFYSLLNSTFSWPFMKVLGDGAMLVKEIDENSSLDELTQKLADILDKINRTNQGFKELCDKFALLRGYETELQLGWGVDRGSVKKTNGDGNIDYIGPNVNKSARLCGIARPFGIIVEKADFPVIPDSSPDKFHEQIRKLEGIPVDVRIWVTSEIATQFIPREKIKEAPEVHVAGVCIKEEKSAIQVLLAKRNSNRRLYPDLYEGCGGQLRYSESFTEGVRRHYRLEMGIRVDVLGFHKLYEIKEPNEPLIPGITFLCIYREGTPDSKNHSLIKWVTLGELEAIPEDDFIPGVKDEFLYLIEAYMNRNG